MRKIVVVVSLLLATVACQSKHHVTPQASAEASVSAAKVQAKIQHCAANANFLTKAGRKAFYACVAPPGEQTQVEACAQKKFAQDGVLTHAARQKFLADLGVCIPA